MPRTTSLIDLFLQHEGYVSDKWQQYLAIYELELSPWVDRNRPLQLLEIGVQNGGSLQLWHKYLPAGSKIVGLDIDEACRELSFPEDVTVVIGDATDSNLLEREFRDRQFDIIIDDGSHFPHDVIKAFGGLFPRLGGGGKYFIEDLHASYWKEFGGGLHKAGSVVEWSKSLIDVLHGDHIREPDCLPAREEFRDLDKHIARVTFFDSMLVIEKFDAPKREPFGRVLTGVTSVVQDPARWIAASPPSEGSRLLFGAAAAKQITKTLLEDLSASGERVSELEGLGAQLAQVKSEGEQVRTELTRTNSEIGQLHAELAQTNSEGQQLRVELTQARSEGEHLRAELAQTKAEGDRLDKELAQKGAESDALRSELRRFAEEGDQRQAALLKKCAESEHLRTELSQLSAVHNATLATVSWRITEPLRWIRRRFPAAAQYGRAMLRIAWWSATFQLASRLRGLRARRGNLALITSSNLWNRQWYLDQYPDVRAAGVDPALHYLSVGADEGRNPSPLFDTQWYLDQSPDVRNAGANPLVHYLRFGAAEGREPRVVQRQIRENEESEPSPPAVVPRPLTPPRANDPYREILSKSFRSYKSSEYRAEISGFDFDLSQAKVKLFAFYLPQFHPIPENDLWWGNGFTEWNNVARALPQFEGHDQPRLPSDLGFYDLRNEAILEQQVALAKKYGIDGFCFHFYWFAGKRLLERPLDTFLSRRDLDLRFCICWANENWTRRWDGQEKEVLIGQHHSPDDDVQVMAEMCKYIDDLRYLTLGGKPVVIVYRVDLLPKPKETAERWRRVVKEQLQKDVFLVCAMTFGNTSHPAKFGFDASVQFPPHCIEPLDITSHVTLWNTDFTGRIYDYEALVSGVGSQLYSFPFPVFPTVFPGWDNSPRRGSSSYVFAGSNPDSYAAWLSEAALFANHRPVHGNSIVFINAWNEWGEGAFLEPDQKYGHTFLRASAEVLRPYCDLVQAPLELRQRRGVSAGQMTVSKPAIIIHAFYPEILLEFLERIPDVRDQALYISVPEKRQEEFNAAVARYAPNAAVFPVFNGGRDVRPFLALLRYARERGHSSFIKLHTKRSIHRPDGAEWRAALAEPLFGLCQHGKMEALLREHPKLGLATAKGQVLDGMSYIGGAGNIAWLQRLSAAASIGGIPRQFVFAGGNMFAGRIEAIGQLLCPEIASLAFEEEQGRRDGTLAHAFERFFGILTQANGFEVAGMEILDDGRFSVSNEKCKKGYQFAQRAVEILVERTTQQDIR